MYRSLTDISLHLDKNNIPSISIINTTSDIIISEKIYYTDMLYIIYYYVYCYI